MSDQMIARLFLGSLAAFVGSMLVAAAAVMVAVNQDVFLMNGPDASASARAPGRGRR